MSTIKQPKYPSTINPSDLFALLGDYISLAQDILEQILVVCCLYESEIAISAAQATRQCSSVRFPIEVRLKRSSNQSMQLSINH